MHSLWRQIGRPGKNPAVVEMEYAKDVCAGVHDRQAGVVSSQNPVWHIWSDWEQREKKMYKKTNIFPKENLYIDFLNKTDPT